MIEWMVNVVGDAEIWQAAIYYLIRLVMFSAVAGLGIGIGIFLRKRKNAKQEAEQ